MRQTVKRERRIVGLGCVMIAAGVVLLASTLEGFAQPVEGGPRLRQSPQTPMLAKPGEVGQAKIALPTFPKKFDVQGPEVDSFGFAVTQPGPIAVEVQAQGAPVVVRLQSPGGQPIVQQGPGLLRIFYNVTPLDVQRNLFWQVQVRAWCEDDCVTAGKRPRASGVVMVQQPPVDQAAVQKAMQAIAAQQKPSSQEQQRAEAEVVAQMDQAFQQRKAQFEQLQQQRRAALYARIQPQVDQLRSRLGLAGAVRPRGLEEAEEAHVDSAVVGEPGTEGDVGTRATPMLQMAKPMRPGLPMLPGQPAAQPLTFPQRFSVQGPEGDSFGIAVTQPGSIHVEVQSQGPPVVVTLQHLASAPLSQQGSGQVRLNYDVTPQDIQRSALWLVRVRLAQAGAVPASGTVMVQHPPADPAIVQAQTAALVEQEHANQPRLAAEAEARSRAAFQEFKARFEQQYQQRLAAERTQNQAFLNRLRTQSGGMIRSRGLNPAITKINKSEGQPKTQIIIEGTNFGPGGEVVFQLGPNITGTAVVEAWADTVIVADVPDASGLLPYQGSIAIRVGQTLSNAVPFTFIPVEEVREIRDAQDLDVSLAAPSIKTGSMIGHPNQSFGGLSGNKGNDIFFPTRQLSNGWVVQNIKLEIDPCAYPDCRGGYVADSRIGTPLAFFNVRWWHEALVGSRYWFSLWITGPRGVPDGIAVTGPLTPMVPAGTPPPATTASGTPPPSSQPLEMTVVPINPALLIPSYQVPGSGTATQNQPPAGQSGTKQRADGRLNPALQEAAQIPGSSMPSQGGTSMGMGSSTPQSQPPASTTPVITSLSVSQGQPGDPLRIDGNNFGPGLGEIHFVIATGKDIKAPGGATWSDGQIFTSVPDGPDTTGLLAFSGQLYIIRASDGKMSNVVPFNFVPSQDTRTISTIPSDRRHSGSFLTYPDPKGWQMTHTRIYGIPFGELAGEKGNDEFFLLARLKNGWTVSAVRFFSPREFYPPTTSGALQLNAILDGMGGAYVEQQGTGANPYLNIRWWINPFAPSVPYRFAIDIVGPKGVPDGIVVP